MEKNEVIGLMQPIQGWLSDHEGIFLYESARNTRVYGDIVEIGSWKGKSTVCLAAGHRESGMGGAVWAIDPHEGILAENTRIQPETLTEFKRNIRAAGVGSAVRAIVKTSADAARDWNKPIRVLFIDGIHDYRHASEDISAWVKYVVPGGMVAFHDGFCGEPGVWKAVREKFLNADGLTEVGTVSSILYGIKGKPGYLRKLYIRTKIVFMKFSNWLNRQSIPDILKTIIIHRVMRILLMNTPTSRVYVK